MDTQLTRVSIYIQTPTNKDIFRHGYAPTCSMNCVESCKLCDPVILFLSNYKFQCNLEKGDDLVAKICSKTGATDEPAGRHHG